MLSASHAVISASSYAGSGHATAIGMTNATRLE